MATFQLGEHTVGPGERPFIIAELSGNHNGSLNRALDTVDAVAASGAQALKIQTYRAETITIDAQGPAFRIGEAHGLWAGRNLFDLYAEASTPWEWHAPIFERARDKGLVVFSTPFDTTALDLLESLDAPLYKIASAELVDLPLIAAVSRTGKPLLLSTGMATLAEIDAAVTTARDNGAQHIVVMACTSSYPADPGDAHLGNLAVLRDSMNVIVGLSDHTQGIGVSVAAVALGAAVVEKHVTLDRAAGGVDSAFSLEPAELAVLTRECSAAHAAVSPARFGPRASEQDVLRLRRSLYVVNDVEVGDAVTMDNIRSIRPSGGLTPAHTSLVLGRTFRRSAVRGTPLTWDLL